jgi:hypothetical protein
MRLRLPCSLKHDAAACMWFDISALLPVCVCVCVCVCVWCVYECSLYLQKHCHTCRYRNIAEIRISVSLSLSLYDSMCLPISASFCVCV